MIGESPISFREFAMKEPLPLGVVHDAVLEFLQNRDDAVLFGAQAVNAYVPEIRATQDVDILSTRADELAEELRSYLADRFHIAVRVREIRDGLGYRVYQVRKPENRHLVDLRPVQALPPAQRVEAILVIDPAELIASKVIASVARQGKAKAYTDSRDIAVLLLRFPELRTVDGPVYECLRTAGASDAAFSEWSSWVDRELLPEDDDDF